ncbi:MAG TPA: SRPBCC family protein [Herpetosiphonaceae bacterium]|nr:SRPBCC family protein [Herpetosiphonaceae bacterium]
MSTLTETTADREIIISRLINAPRERVFAAWTDPQQVGHWWGPQGFTTTTTSMDVRPGGRWSYVMHGPDGTDYANLIVYSEVEAPARLVYAHGSGEDNDPGQFQTTVTFEDVDGTTRLTMRSLFATAEARDYVVREFGAIEAGNSTLDQLEAYLAGGKD